MLHDPHHDLNTHSFRDFVANKPADQIYQWQDREDCACAQFARHIGLFDEWYEDNLIGGSWGKLNRLALCGREVYPSVTITWGELLKHIDRKLAVA